MLDRFLTFYADHPDQGTAILLAVFMAFGIACLTFWHVINTLVGMVNDDPEKYDTDDDDDDDGEA